MAAILTLRRLVQIVINSCNLNLYCKYEYLKFLCNTCLFFYEVNKHGNNMNC